MGGYRQAVLHVGGSVVAAGHLTGGELTSFATYTAFNVGMGLAGLSRLYVQPRPVVRLCGFTII